MRLKEGVNPFGIRPELMMALLVADEVWKDFGENLVVTSINDSKHSDTSLHYAGQAADLRTRHWSPLVASDAASKLREYLGGNPDYDVIVEKTHIHLEYQPKRKD